MKRRDQTSMGGEAETFFTTHWSLIEDIQSGQDKDRILIGSLLERYWKPVYCFLRRKGYGNEQAKDLTQGFFHEIVLNRGLIKRADQAKGRFRSFMLHALGEYLIDQRRKESAQKRVPKEKRVPLDMVEPPALPERITRLGPEDCFHYAWKSALLDHTLSEVQARCLEQGFQTHWHLFRERVVQPTLENLEPPSLKQICARHHIEDEAKASNMIITVKRRFQAALQKNVRTTVISANETHDELKEILTLFPKSAGF
ncbi:hypothetical protein ACFL3F_02630 [Planctomycetota bacterium]